MLLVFQYEYWDKFIYVSKVEAEWECILQWEVDRQEEALFWGFLRLQAFIGVCRDGDGKFWKTGLCVINSQRLG
jgi:hypothetical protein